MVKLVYETNGGKRFDTFDAAKAEEADEAARSAIVQKFDEEFFLHGSSDDDVVGWFLKHYTLTLKEA